MEDAELSERFLAGTLEVFSHRDHVRTAFLLLNENDFETASEVMSERIRAMAAASGDPAKFHATRTEAWLRLISTARGPDRSPGNSEDFLSRHPELLRSNRLDEYYSPERLRSDAARGAFLEPDLAPLR